MAEVLRRYVDRKFSENDLRSIGVANKIIQEYQKQGLTLTLRQLYYQHVARDCFPEDRRWRSLGNNKWVRDPDGTPNATPNYTWLGKLISEARLAGLVSWMAIEDRRRNLKGHAYSKDSTSAIRGLAESYRIDKWRDQDYRPEVWIEKEALEGVIAGICSELEVDFFACVGYNSQSEQWRAGRRFAGYVSKGQTPIVFHLGDHDPSGIDMTRDNRDRLSMFAGVPIQVVRLALNRNQIDELDPPPNPAKMSDPRFGDYQAEHGEESWELDALDPLYIRNLIRTSVERMRDETKWQAALDEEASQREVLTELAEQLGERSGE